MWYLGTVFQAEGSEVHDPCGQKVPGVLNSLRGLSVAEKGVRKWEAGSLEHYTDPELNSF